MTRSGSTAIICPALAVQESARMVRGFAVISGTTSAQYFVQATTRSSSPTAARMTVALGCRQAIRRGVCEGMSVALISDLTQRCRKCVEAQLRGVGRSLRQAADRGNHVLAPQFERLA